MALGLDAEQPGMVKKNCMSRGLKFHFKSIFNGYKIGNELILINGIFTFLGLLLISKKGDNTNISL
jgi:hypothetical protein